jgi:CRP-like cAMP-binding protein
MSAAALKGFATFAELSEAERQEVAELLEPRELSPGETLFAEGDEADALVLVVNGSLRLASRRAREEATVGGGSQLGGYSLFAVSTRQTSAVGAERARVLLLRRHDFLRLAEDSPRTACRIATALGAELAAQARAALDALAPAASVDPAAAGE